jgi:hypothetical protein
MFNLSLDSHAILFLASLSVKKEMVTHITIHWIFP